MSNKGEEYFYVEEEKAKEARRTVIIEEDVTEIKTEYPSYKLAFCDGKIFIKDDGKVDVYTKTGDLVWERKVFLGQKYIPVSVGYMLECMGKVYAVSVVDTPKTTLKYIGIKVN